MSDWGLEHVEAVLPKHHASFRERPSRLEKNLVGKFVDRTASSTGPSEKGFCSPQRERTEQIIDETEISVGDR